MQSNYRELITGISLPTSAQCPLSLAHSRSFSPIKQYLYANHPGLIATALHAWVIRVTIMVSRSPIVSFAATGAYPCRFPCRLPYVVYNGFCTRRTKNPGSYIRDIITKHSHYSVIRIPGFFRNAVLLLSLRVSLEIRYAYCSARNDLISCEKGDGPSGIYPLQRLPSAENNFE